MNPLIYLRLSFRALAANKLRSVLAMLGIVIGVTAVICVVSLGEGANRMVQEQIRKLGANRLLIVPGSDKTGGFHGGLGAVQSLKEEDYEAIMRECPEVALGSPGVKLNTQVVHGNQNWYTTVRGCNESFPALRSWEIERGRFFTAAANHGADKVCVLGQTVVENLFGADNPIGRTVRIMHLPFIVIGVFARKGQAPWGGDFDDLVIAPFKTVKKRLMAIDHIQNIECSATSLETIDEAQDEITGVLRRRHRLPAGEADDFMVRNQKEISEMAAAAAGVLTMLLGSIAGVSLVVGGIGVMNIMLVSVTERTREIGLRMAVGARARDVLVQFLTEAVCLTGLGGTMGILAAFGAAAAFRAAYAWPVRVSPLASAVSFLFSATIGVAFGLYPAWRASKMDPVEALRQL